MDQNENAQGMETRTAAETEGTPSAGAAEEPTAAVSADWESWEEDAILPEGWKPGDPPLLSTPDLSGFTAPEPEAAETVSSDAGNEGEPAASQDSQTAPDSDRQPDGGETDWKALYEQEVAKNEAEREAQRERQNAEKYRSIVRDLMERDGVPEYMAKAAAANECGGKNYPLTDAPDQAAASAAPNGQARQPVDYGEAVHRIHVAFPDATEMPAEVTQAILRGEDGVAAYGAYQSRTVAGENRQLREEVARLRSQLDAVRRAPVRGVTGQAPQQKPKDLFEQGFDSDNW